jgi:hypothetical protein
MTGIILNIIAIVCCLIALIIDIIQKDTGWCIIMTGLIILNAILLKTNLDKLNKPETYIVNDVKEYYIDSTLVINGTDTTKTYTITYLK